MQRSRRGRQSESEESTTITVVVEAAGLRKELALAPGNSIEDALRSIGLIPDAHIVFKGKTPVPITDTLKDGDLIRAVRVASGG